MKKINLIIASIFVVGIISAVFITPHATEYPSIRLPEVGGEVSSPHIDVNIQEKSLTKKITADIYEVVKPDFKKIQNMLTNKFSIKGDFIKKEDKVYYVDDKITVDYDLSNGYWTYTNKSIDNGIFESKIPSKLSDKQCKEIALQVAENFQVNVDLLRNIVVTPILYEPAMGTPVIVGHNVYLKSKIEDKDVYGVSRFCVEIDAAGQIGVINNYYKEVKSYAKQNIKTIKEAINDLETGKGVILSDEDLKSVNITSYEVSYYDDPSSFDEQPYVQPVIVFKGIGERKDGSSTEIKSIVRAIN